MNQASNTVNFDKHLKMFEVDFVEDDENETAVFTNADAASDFVRELQAKGYTELRMA